MAGLMSKGSFGVVVTDNRLYSLPKGQHHSRTASPRSSHIDGTNCHLQIICSLACQGARLVAAFSQHITHLTPSKPYLSETNMTASRFFMTTARRVASARALRPSRRCLSTAPDIMESSSRAEHLPVTVFSEDETMTRDAVRQWSREELLPLVREMDQTSTMNPQIVQSLFQHGLMGLEVDPEYGGSGLSFTSACLAIEEISRVDPDPPYSGS